MRTTSDGQHGRKWLDQNDWKRPKRKVKNEREVVVMYM